jgi:hypothetical protein
MLERILTPFQLLDSPDADEIQRLARGATCKRFFHHYRGFYGRMCQDWRKAEQRTVKGLLYAYRSALTGIHLLRTGDCVGDVARLASLYGFGRVKEVVARKAAGTEHGAMSATEAFDDDLERLESLLSSAHSESALPESSPNVAEIDRFLVEMRRRHFG